MAMGATGSHCPMGSETHGREGVLNIPDSSPPPFIILAPRVVGEEPKAEDNIQNVGFSHCPLLPGIAAGPAGPRGSMDGSVLLPATSPPLPVLTIHWSQLPLLSQTPYGGGRELTPFQPAGGPQAGWLATPTPPVPSSQDPKQGVCSQQNAHYHFHPSFFQQMCSHYNSRGENRKKFQNLFSKDIQIS